MEDRDERRSWHDDDPVPDGAEIEDEFRGDGWWDDADVLPSGEDPDGSEPLEPAPAPETLLEELNDEQRAAVQHESGPLLILAGPGSGKTRVICHRIAWLVRRGVVRAGNILGVTFTNKAAGEMRERVEGLLGDDARGLRLSTYHALCARMLRSDGRHIDVPQHFVIYDRDDTLKAARLVIKKLDLGEGMASPRSLVARISSWKNEFRTPEEMAVAAGNHREKKLAEAFDGYQRLLKEADALDFDDLLLYGVTLIASNEDIRRKYAERFRYILVDEYQDTNDAQYQLTLYLAEKHRNVCAVGDPDQAIYGWRGADVGNIDQFQKDFPEAAVVRLERNYRSSNVIVDTAATLIETNRGRPDKRMWTDRTRGAPIDVITADTDHDEADRICEVVRTAPREPRQTAVLYRMNAQSRTIEDSLRRAEVPYHIVGNIRFYERREIKDALAYLKSVINPSDDVSLRRIINVPPRRIGDRTIEKLASVDGTVVAGAPLLGGLDRAVDPRSLWSKLVHATDNRLLSGAALIRVRGFRDLMEKMRCKAADERVTEAVTAAVDDSGYLQALRAENTEEANERIANLMELVSAARDYEDNAERPSLRDFVDRQSLLSEADEGEGPSEAHVWLMTLHAAKGLEFPTVVMAGVEEGLLPHSRSQESEAEIAEERRLCYVGMTRAMNRLVMTNAALRRRYGSWETMKPSRFLAEMQG